MKGLSKRTVPASLMRTLCCLFAAWAAISMSGCASIGQTKSSIAPARAKTGVGWWYASFHINWPQDEEPLWHNDLIIAHRIVSPVLSRFEKDILLWRFHRRAAPDQVGHKFSFIFYSTPATAQKTYDAIEAMELLQEMKSSGVIVRTAYDDTTRIGRPNIEGTSDTSWSPPVQKSWPYFIMGVSQMWLDLISQFAEDVRQKPSTFDEIQAFYREIEKNVRETWEKEGGHAYLHHLNAVFGYNPIMIYKKFQMRF